MPQQQAYLTPEEDTELRNYARSHGLDATALANMLLIRELRLGRLKTEQFPVLDPGGQRQRSRKITAHLQSEDQKGSFTAHAVACGLRPATAASMLLRAELLERWLERAMRWNGLTQPESF